MDNVLIVSEKEETRSRLSALLAALPQAEAATIIQANAPRLGAYGDLDHHELLQLCAKARQQGHAVTGNHAVPGVRAVGLPLLNTAGSPIAAIAVAATQSRMTSARIAHILPLMRQALDDLARLLRQ